MYPSLFIILSLKLVLPMLIKLLLLKLLIKKNIMMSKKYLFSWLIIITIVAFFSIVAVNLTFSLIRELAPIVLNDLQSFYQLFFLAVFAGTFIYFIVFGKQFALLQTSRNILSNIIKNL
jgi:hypothetical protein